MNEYSLFGKSCLCELTSDEHETNMITMEPIETDVYMMSVYRSIKMARAGNATGEWIVHLMKFGISFAGIYFGYPWQKIYRLYRI